MDGELGGMFVLSSATPWNQYGAYVGVYSPYAASLFAPAAIKVSYTRFHVHKPSDDKDWSYFPFTALKEYGGSGSGCGKGSHLRNGHVSRQEAPGCLGLVARLEQWPCVKRPGRRTTGDMRSM